MKFDVNDIVGKNFGNWEVLKYSHYVKYKHYYICKCKCGNIRTVRRDALIAFKTKSCGCSELDDIIGKKFGRLTVISFSGSTKKSDNRHYYHYYLCKCDCGNTKVIERARLLNNHTQSCGCLQIEALKRAFTKHNLSNHRLHRIWEKMKYRCLNPKSPRYQDYGGRGIIICQEWKDDFMSFYNWSMANGYTDNLTIDRINVNGNYEPTNCRWVNMKTQARNSRHNRLITFCGQTHCLSEWAEKYDILPDTLQMRLTRGWDIRKALLTPVKKN